VQVATGVAEGARDLHFEGCVGDVGVGGGDGGRDEFEIGVDVFVEELWP
jgi:hypothetical protein